MELHARAFASDLTDRIDLAADSSDSNMTIQSIGDLHRIAKDVSPNLFGFLHPFANALEKLTMHDSHVDQSPRNVCVLAVLDFRWRRSRLAEVDAMIREGCVYVLRVKGHRTRFFVVGSLFFVL